MYLLDMYTLLKQQECMVHVSYCTSTCTSLVHTYVHIPIIHNHMYM